MADLEAQTTFTITEPPAEYLETVDLILLPENAGSHAARELRYPEDVLPPLIYLEPPDQCENFDTGPLTARPALKGTMTLEDTSLARWPGYIKDWPIKEIWTGDNKTSRMTAYFFRRLWEYFANPPASGYITWTPKDRGNQAYNIEIESLTVGGQDTVSFNTIALSQGYVLGVVTLTFRIIGAV